MGRALSVRGEVIRRHKKGTANQYRTQSYMEYKDWVVHTVGNNRKGVHDLFGAFDHVCVLRGYPLSCKSIYRYRSMTVRVYEEGVRNNKYKSKVLKFQSGDVVFIQTKSNEKPTPSILREKDWSRFDLAYTLWFNWIDGQDYPEVYWIKQREKFGTRLKKQRLLNG